MKNCKIPVRDPAAGEILLSSAAYRRKDRGISLLILILACRGRYVKKIMKISIKYAGLEIVCCIQNAWNHRFKVVCELLRILFLPGTNMHKNKCTGFKKRQKIWKRQVTKQLKYFYTISCCVYLTKVNVGGKISQKSFIFLIRSFIGGQFYGG